MTGCLPVGQDHELADLSNIIIAKNKNSLPVIVNQLLTEPQKETPPNTGSKTLNAGKIKNKTKCRPQKCVLKEPFAEAAKNQKPAISYQTSPESNSLPPPNISQVLPLLYKYSGQDRAFLKIQDGCDAYCTYCIIPKIRTNVCNKAVKDVLLEARNLVDDGHREIVLTGVFLGAYGQSTARRKRWEPERIDSLAELLNQTAEVNGLERLRLGSLEPLDVTERLLEVMTSHSNIAPHLHLSLQSGSPNVLRKMARQYTIEDFWRVIERVRKAFDRSAITTDIIVGFPGETEEDFQKTMQVVEETGFTKVHVFPFSMRKGTSAEKMAGLFGRVSGEEIRRRAERLIRLDADLQQRFRQACLGMEERVLIERVNPAQGLCGRYFTVDVSARPDSKEFKIGQMVSTIIG